MHTSAVSHSLARTTTVRRLSLAAASLLSAALLSFVLVAAAEAHETSTALEGDRSFAVMFITHDTLAVCDAQADGHYAYLRRTDRWGWPLAPVYDPDEAHGTCGYVRGVNPWSLSSYNVCVQHEGCARPVYVEQF